MFNYNCLRSEIANGLIAQYMHTRRETWARPKLMGFATFRLCSPNGFGVFFLFLLIERTVGINWLQKELSAQSVRAR